MATAISCRPICTHIYFRNALLVKKIVNKANGNILHKDARHAFHNTFSSNLSEKNNQKERES